MGGDEAEKAPGDSGLLPYHCSGQEEEEVHWYKTVGPSGNGKV